MKVVCFGSLNFDHNYRVAHFPQPGETIASERYDIRYGGKGLNQSIAAARAGANVTHAGHIGPDGMTMLEALRRDNVDTSFVAVVEEPTGHASIQINDQGENAIIVYGGANRTITSQYIDSVMRKCNSGDWLLLQNEINSIPAIIEAAADRGMNIAFNPAPMDTMANKFPISKIDTLIVNRGEGTALVGEGDERQLEPNAIIEKLLMRYPMVEIVLTLGEEGAIYADAHRRFAIRPPAVTPKDTTGAGDTLIGYYVALSMKDREAKRDNLTIACAAAALSTTRHGAMDSIPAIEEVNSFISNLPT